MKLVVLLKYDGTSFDGFQAQPSGNTVQQHLTDAASRVLGCRCAVTGCSRTDSGVHALGFVATVEPAGDHGDGWCRIPPEKFHRAIRPYLRHDIAVIGCAEVPDSFHPRYGALGKRYVYLMKDSPAADPFLERRAWQLMRPIDDDAIKRMCDSAELFVGRHDFAGFMSSGSRITDTVRCVSYASVCRRDDGMISFTVEADGFLYNMVRIMAGTLSGVAAGSLSAESVKCAIDTGDRSKAGMTAPPHGLYLERVIYPEPIDFLCN